MNGVYIDMPVHCVPRDGGGKFCGWRQILAQLLARNTDTHGTGLFSRLFTPAVEPGGTVYAVDISKTFIDNGFYT